MRKRPAPGPTTNALRTGEKRDFLPSFVAEYTSKGHEVRVVGCAHMPGRSSLRRFAEGHVEGLFALFMGKGKCRLCHISTGKQPLFTDYTFDNLGIPKNPENPVYVSNPDFVDPGLGGFLATRPDYAPYADANMGKHKVPTLRNVALGLPDIVKAYGHNGYVKTLEGIVNFYNTRDVKPVCPGDYTEAQALAAGCWPSPEVMQNLNTAELGNLGLTPDEEVAIVAFLKTLSDGYVP